MRKRATLTEKVDLVDKLLNELKDARDYLDLGDAEKDVSVVEDAVQQTAALERKVRKSELQRMLSGPADRSGAIVSIHPGSGGAEAKDWADMLLRMYLRWCERRGFATDIIDYQAGDEAGIDGASFTVSGDSAYGYLRSGIGWCGSVPLTPMPVGTRVLRLLRLCRILRTRSISRLTKAISRFPRCALVARAVRTSTRLRRRFA